MAAVVLFVMLPAAADPVPRSGARSGPNKPPCARVVASALSSHEVRPVGVVTQGVKRAVFVMDAAQHGYLVRPGECLGREQVPFDRVLHTFDDGVHGELVGDADARPR